VDILGDAAPETYAKAVDIAAKDPNSDGVMVILTPQAMTDPTATAEAIKPFAHLEGKPILASWMGGLETAAGENILNKAGIPTFNYPDTGARAFQYMWNYSQNLKALYETPALPSETKRGENARSEVEALIQNVRKSGRTILTEFESKKLLSAYGIPTVETLVAKSEAEAVKLAEKIGYPVVLKLFSETITHKTDVGGVQLNLSSEAAVRAAYTSIQESVTRAAGAEHFLGVTVQPMVRPEGYELILGSSIDSQFGPVLLFGSGGQLVEVYKDRAIGLPPLNTTLARLLMERTRIFSALGGVRGRKPVNLVELEKLLVRFSYLATEQKWIKEIDINPLLASAEGLLALDARVVLYSKDVLDPPLPAIRPYPVQYVKPWRFEDGTEVMIRPIRPEDEGLIARFHARLSERSIYQRYFHLLSLDQRVSHDRLLRVCFGDYNREIALVAEYREPITRQPEILAVGRLSKAHLENEAELAVLITDENQGRGLGTELSRRLIEIARDEKLDRVTVEILGGNRQMLEVCRLLGFDLNPIQDGVVHGVFTL
jgi:acetyltransferase